jgi:lysozyme family protein
MMIQQQTWWRNYIDHLEFFEGKTSKDPKDYAAKCAPKKGMIHTNIGVTYCTFKALASMSGIQPVTYDRFLKLTKEDVSAILYYGFYNYMNLKYFKPAIALSLLEIAWAAGPDQSAKILNKSLAQLGHPAPMSSRITMEMINQAGKTGVNQLFSAIWNNELAYLQSLPTWPNYGSGWTTRIKAFIDKFKP